MNFSTVFFSPIRGVKNSVKRISEVPRREVFNPVVLLAPTKSRACGMMTISKLTKSNNGYAFFFFNS